jgi:hypothetical protein
MKILAILSCALAVTASSLFADSPAPPVPYVAVAPRGAAYFKMIPRPGGKWEDGFGIAYRLRQDGSDEELWRTDGWYSFEVFLSYDGDYLVAMGPWNAGHEPGKEDMAVAFYRRGKLLRQYSTADLVKDKSKVRASVSHYMWLARDVGRFPEAKKDTEAELRIFCDNTFRLKTCDGIVYEFDMTTGEIKKKKA